MTREECEFEVRWEIAPDFVPGSESWGWFGFLKVVVEVTSDANRVSFGPGQADAVVVQWGDEVEFGFSFIWVAGTARGEVDSHNAEGRLFEFNFAV